MGAGWLALALVCIVGVALWGAVRFGRVRAERDWGADAGLRAREARQIDEVVAGLDDGDLDRRLHGGGDK